MGIGSTGYVLRLVPLVSEDSTGGNLQLVVPFDTQLKLVVRSSFFHVNDESGLPLARTVSMVIPVTVPFGQGMAAFRFAVTGTDQ
jgi:hypothetical protein